MNRPNDWLICVLFKRFLLSISSLLFPPLWLTVRFLVRLSRPELNCHATQWHATDWQLHVSTLASLLYVFSTLCLLCLLFSTLSSLLCLLCLLFSTVFYVFYSILCLLYNGNCHPNWKGRFEYYFILGDLKLKRMYLYTEWPCHHWCPIWWIKYW